MNGAGMSKNYEFYFHTRLGMTYYYFGFVSLFITLLFVESNNASINFIKQSIFILKTVFSVISNYLNLLGITYEYLRIIKTNAQVRMMRF